VAALVAAIFSGGNTAHLQLALQRISKISAAAIDFHDYARYDVHRWVDSLTD
jgi:hypothetical protein